MAKGRPPGSKNKSIDNGIHPFEEEDGRLAPQRRYRNLVAGIVGDLGGPPALSTGERQLAKRAAFVSVQCEIMEQASVRGGEIDLTVYGMLVDRLSRTFRVLGIKRVPRDVATLNTYLTAAYSESAEPAEEP